MNRKNKDLDWIKKFSKITVKKSCEKNKINRANLLNNKTSNENTRIIKEDLESEIAKLYIKKDDDKNVD